MAQGDRGGGCDCGDCDFQMGIKIFCLCLKGVLVRIELRTKRASEKEGYEGRQAHFYSKSTIENENYFSYYCPLFDENDQCVGMVFAGKPSDYVDWIVWKSVVPILLLVLLSMIILIFVI